MTIESAIIWAGWLIMVGLLFNGLASGSDNKKSNYKMELGNIGSGLYKIASVLERRNLIDGDEK